MKRRQDEQYPFKKGIAKKPSQKRIDSVKDKSIFDFGIICSSLQFFLRWRGLREVIPFLVNVLHKFCILQFFEKIRIYRIPIKNVDHELDLKIPFRTDVLDVYLDFINYWLRLSTLLLKRFGGHQGMKLASEFIRYITAVYKQAYKLYSEHLTTTVRPATKDRQVNAMRFWDPHYCCVPSLHISIVCLTIGFYQMVFEREDFSAEEKEKWNKQIFDYGIEISESVLYLKQHSVNCVAAALYMMSRSFPEIFSPMLGVKFIDSMFANAKDMSKEDGEQIRAHLHLMYEHLLLAGSIDEDWTDPVMIWLKNYKAVEIPSD